MRGQGLFLQPDREKKRHPPVKLIICCASKDSWVGGSRVNLLAGDFLAAEKINILSRWLETMRDASLLFRIIVPRTNPGEQSELSRVKNIPAARPDLAPVVSY